MVREALKTFIGITLLPLVASISIVFYRQFGSIESAWTKGQQYFIGGIATYCLIQLLLVKPVLIYVLGHEAVHALATWMCFGKVKSFKVSSAGGSISTSKSNLFISLSPYFIPIYTILLIIVYYVINDVFLGGILKPTYFMFLLGVTLSFHIVMTIDTLKTRQPDLIRTGYLTSSVLIYAINMILVAGILGLSFESFSFKAFLNKTYFLSIDIYGSIFKQLFL
jgi:hypothetical protein